MENIPATHPLQHIHLDYITIKAIEGGKDVHILVITDHFTQYAQALVTKSQTAQALWDKFKVHYSLPESLISDQGNHFESSLTAEL